MTKSKSNRSTQEALEAIEQLPSLELSAEWTDTLMQRLDYTTMRSDSVNTKGFFITLALIILTVNLNFIVLAMDSNNREAFNKDKQLRLIEKELLVSPISNNK
jgi:hypothetical protein